eukprot:6861332-Lingulodinium_polyedra.AAC.1
MEQVALAAEKGTQQPPLFMSPAWAWVLIRRSLLASKISELEGMAPAGDLERKVQEALDAMRDR